PPALVGGVAPELLMAWGQLTVVSATSGLAASPKPTFSEPLPRSVIDTWPSPDSLSRIRSRRSIRSLGVSPDATAFLIAWLRLASSCASCATSPFGEAISELYWPWASLEACVRRE